jgi:hypothetical protein
MDRARGQEGPYDRAEFTKENQSTAGNPIAHTQLLLLQRMPPQSSLASAALPCMHYAMRGTISSDKQHLKPADISVACSLRYTSSGFA